MSSLLDLAGWFAPELTGRENVRFFHEVILDGRGDWKTRAAEVEEFAGIGAYFDRPVRTYSSGMFLRLAFAAAISEAPEILLIDEVIAVGDARFQQRCYRRVRELRDSGATILFVTHAVEGVHGLCDRVLLFDRGRLAFDGDPAEGVDRYYQLFFMAPDRSIPERSEHDELRFGSGGATIAHSFASRDGVHAATAFERGDRVRVIADVEFARAVAAPHFGFSCSTTAGVRLYATTTTMLKAHPVRAAAGERRRVEFAFDVAVAVTDLFVDLSVFELSAGSVSVLDARIGGVHLTIASASLCYGLVDLSAAFGESVLDDDPVGSGVRG
jgi:energy-coupling factor transporter ATP-binding protein EcfA2